MVDANKCCNVVLIDVIGAFLHALTDEEIIMLLWGPLAEMMVIIDLFLRCKYITYDSKGVVLFYVKINKVLYSLLKSALLFYQKLRGELKSIEFKFNP